MPVVSEQRVPEEAEVSVSALESAALEEVGEAAAEEEVGEVAAEEKMGEVEAVEEVRETAAVMAIGEMAAEEKMGEAAVVEEVGEAAAVMAIGDEAVVEEVGEAPAAETMEAEAEPEWPLEIWAAPATVKEDDWFLLLENVPSRSSVWPPGIFPPTSSPASVLLVEYQDPCSPSVPIIPICCFASDGGRRDTKAEDDGRSEGRRRLVPAAGRCRRRVEAENCGRRCREEVVAVSLGPAGSRRSAA